MKLILICVISGFVAKYMSTALFWVIMQRAVTISYRLFGTTYRSHLQGSRIQKKACCSNISHSPPPTHLHQPYWLTPPLLRLFMAHSIPVQTPYWDNRLSFGFAPEDGTDRLSLNVGKKWPLPAA